MTFTSRISQVRDSAAQVVVREQQHNNSALRTGSPQPTAAKRLREQNVF
jgi:hypothetical protein